MRLAIIPARGGSKRIPGKNIRDFCGKPMIAWSIEAAHDSQCFDQVIVSTDDDEIATLASKLGAEVPFMRPSELADDHTTTGAVMQHAIQTWQTHHHVVDFACCIYATAPMTNPDMIRRGLLLMQDYPVDYCFTVARFSYPVQRALRVNCNGEVRMLDSRLYTTRSQDLEPLYHDAGQFYWGTADAWLQQRPVLSSPALPIILPAHQVQDIDTEDDWQRAEQLFLLNNRPDRQQVA